MFDSVWYCRTRITLPSYLPPPCVQLTAADLALLYVADMTQYYIQVDWARFPRLAAVISTVRAVPPIKAYLAERDKPADTQALSPTA